MPTVTASGEATLGHAKVRQCPLAISATRNAVQCRRWLPGPLGFEWRRLPGCVTEVFIVIRAAINWFSPRSR
jgi:hypothetical protein